MNAKPLDPNLAMVLMGVIGIIVPVATLVVNFVENSRNAKHQSAEVRDVGVKIEDARRDLTADATAAAVAVQDVAKKVDEARQESAAQTAATIEVAAVAEKVEQTCLDVAANAGHVETIEELKRLLQNVAPKDARVKALLSR